MKGLELSKEFYATWGKELLERDFADTLPLLAIGLVGSGSECYGFDDELSTDHDFEPAFCIFLPEEDLLDRQTAFKLERAYAKLPKEFKGFTRNSIDPVGGSRHGIIRMDEFYLSKIGSADGRLSLKEWFSLPEYALLEATNGEIFADNLGKFTEIRERIAYYPEPVRLKKLAGNLLLMGQAGQYNYNRCIKRGDTAAAQLAVFEFVKSAIGSVYLLNRAYTPYYKWCFRGLKELKKLNSLSGDLEYLISSGNTAAETARKTELIEKICSAVADELRSQNLTATKGFEMEQLAYSVNEGIFDHNIRTMHILCGV